LRQTALGAAAEPERFGRLTGNLETAMTYRIDELAASDWPDVADIYRTGIATGNATFETRVPTWPEWDAAHLPICRLACRKAEGLAGWAALSPVSRRECYRGVAEVSVYVAEGLHGQGLGLAILQALVAASEVHGIWTLQASTFPENRASLRIQERCGFRVLGRREHIAQLAGVWRDTILTERRSPCVGT
jgi:phosphinothricin acetyltransferase